MKAKLLKAKELLDESMDCLEDGDEDGAMLATAKAADIIDDLIDDANTIYLDEDD